MIEPRLSEFVADILPAARIEKTVLPNQTGLALYLLNADYPQQGLTQSQMLRLMDEPFYWGFCWASGLVLSQYLLDNPEWVKGKRVVDFGCGSGVAALAAIKAGAREVIACDIDPMAKYATLKNAELNGLTLGFSDDFQTIEGHVDIILVADVLYDKANLPWLASFVARADQVIVADSRVKNFDFPPYQQVARYEGCTIPDLDESQEFRDVRLYLASSI